MGGAAQPHCKQISVCCMQSTPEDGAHTEPDITTPMVLMQMAAGARNSLGRGISGNCWGQAARSLQASFNTSTFTATAAGGAYLCRIVITAAFSLSLCPPYPAMQTSAQPGWPPLATPIHASRPRAPPTHNGPSSLMSTLPHSFIPSRSPPSPTPCHATSHTV